MIPSTTPSTGRFESTNQHDPKEPQLHESIVKSLSLASKGAKIANIEIPGSVGKAAKIGRLSNTVIDNLSSNTPVQSSVCAVVGEGTKIVAGTAILSAGMVFVPEVTIPALITEVGTAGAIATVVGVSYVVDKTVGVITEPLGKAAEYLCNSTVEMTQQLFNEPTKPRQRIANALKEINKESKEVNAANNNNRQAPYAITSTTTAPTSSSLQPVSSSQLALHLPLPQADLKQTRINTTTPTNNAMMLSKLSTTALNYAHTPIPSQKQNITPISMNNLSANRATLFANQPNLSASQPNLASTPWLKTNNFTQTTPVPSKTPSTIFNHHAQTRIPSSSAIGSQSLYSSTNMTFTKHGQNFQTRDNIFAHK